MPAKRESGAAMRIAVGFNGSDRSREALKVAEAHAKAFNAEIHVFTLTAHSPELNTPEIEAAEGELKSLKERLTNAGFVCETHLVIRSLTQGEDLVNLVREHKIDELILGVRKRSRVGKFLMGSTAQFVILNSECPIVVVK
jgi:nucleotide-binding universal stress UspA family protein